MRASPNISPGGKKGRDPVHEGREINLFANSGGGAFRDRV